MEDAALGDIQIVPPSAGAAGPGIMVANEEVTKALVENGKQHLAALQAALADLSSNPADTPSRGGPLKEAIQAASALRECVQILIDASLDSVPQAEAETEVLQNALVDAGALEPLVRLAFDHDAHEGWLVLQSLCFKNKKACALVIKDNHYVKMLDVLMAHPEETRDDAGNVVASTPPSQGAVSAAFLLSTLVVHNRQHNKLVTPKLLKRIVQWILGRDASLETTVDVLGRQLTLTCRSISIARELAVNAAMHEDLNAAGVAAALAESVSLETDPRRKVASIVSICMLVDPNQEDNTGKGVMAITDEDLSTIMQAVNCSMRDIACYGQEWRMWNLMLALQKLSVKEENRRLMLEYSVDVIGMLDVILNGKYEMASLVQRYALLTCWNLSFEASGAERIRASKLLSSVQAIKDSTTSLKTLEAAKGVLFTLGQLVLGEATAETVLDGGGASKASTAKREQHIMISYEWSHQQRVIVLKGCLEELGYRVWLDLENMSGSTLEAMAHAVEDSAAVICCISRRYKNSQACRTEAEYAFQQRKRIIPVVFEKGFKATGWLGALMGTRLYFTMNETYQVQSATKRLSLELGNICRDMSRTRPATAAKESSDAGDSRMPTAAAEATAPAAATPAAVAESVYPVEKLDTQSMGAVPDWTPKDVATWLKSLGMEELGKRWERKKVDGLALQGLLELTADGSLRKALVYDLHVRDPREMLHIVAHLGMLFNMGHQ